LSRDNDEFENFGMGVDRLFSETFGMIEGSLFDIATRSLRPLFSLDVNEDTVTATFDLPGANRDEINITCTEDTISVEAEMVRPVRLRVSTGRHEQEEFLRYSKKILLPVRVDPAKGSAKYRNGMVVVKIPRLREGRSIQIDADPKVKRLRE